MRRPRNNTRKIHTYPSPRRHFAGLAAASSIFVAAFSTPAKAATAYFFVPSSTGYSRLVTDGTDSFWGTFDFPNNISNGTALGDTSGSIANITYSGKPSQSGGSGSTSNSRWASSTTGTYNSWSYNAANNFLYFYSTSGQDSLRLTIENGLVGGGGWMKITGIAWCQQDAPSGTNTACTSQASWGSITGGGIAYIRVPSPALIAGLGPFALLLLARKRKGSKKASTTPLATNMITSSNSRREALPKTHLKPI